MAESSRASDGTIRVLHVDDTSDFTDLTATALEREEDQFEVTTATSVSDGLDQLSDTPFDCILSDYDMPGQDGLDFLTTVRAKYPDLPFILLTGKGSEEVASEAISGGVTDYLQKQAGTDQYTLLANRIRNAVEKARAQHRERRLAEAVEHAEEGIVIFDPDGYCRYANDRCADIYVTDPANLAGTHWGEWYPNEQVPSDRDEILATLDTDGVWHGRTTQLNADGNTFEVDHTVSRTDDGWLVCTVRPRADPDARTQQLTWFRTVVEALNDPVYVLNETGQFQYVNDAFVELVGYDRDRILGSYPRLIKDDEAVATAKQQLGRLLSTDGPDSVTFEITIQPKVGEPIWCEDHMSVLPYEGPQFNGSVGVLRDISERRAHERELERQNDRLGEFASIVSHDLRSPLQVAEGRLEFVQEECDSDHIADIWRALDRMDALIDDLLTLAREGERVGELEPVNLAELTETGWRDVATGDATLTTDIDQRIQADRSRLQQLIENLLRNAVEHGGGDVTITIGELDNGFYVKDDGPGIPEDERADVFEAGYSTAEDGTGFGLSIVKQVADAHNWTIRVTDGSEGGAQFEITGVELAAE